MINFIHSKADQNQWYLNKLRCDDRWARPDCPFAEEFLLRFSDVFLGFFLGEHSLTIPVVSDAEDRPFVGALKAEAVDGLAGNFSRVDQRKIKRWKIVESFWF